MLATCHAGGRALSQKNRGGDDLPSLDAHIDARSKACLAFNGSPRRIRPAGAQALVSLREGWYIGAAILRARPGQRDVD
jgi:hypothetical protein